MANTPTTLRRVMRWWPPYLGAGVRVVEADPGGRHLTVEHRVTRLTRNAFGTAFGGTMSSMTDPFFCLLVAHRLGPGYRVWDTQGHIAFRTPGHGRLRATFVVTDEAVEQIREATEAGRKHLRWFRTDIRDESGTVVAEVSREVYVRRTRITRSGPGPRGDSPAPADRRPDATDRG
ncbi:MAG: DUF4442 domain-containing protein [Gordonia paraffinivorans]